MRFSFLFLLLSSVMAAAAVLMGAAAKLAPSSSRRKRNVDKMRRRQRERREHLRSGRVIGGGAEISSLRLPETSQPIFNACLRALGLNPPLNAQLAMSVGMCTTHFFFFLSFFKL